MDKEDQGQEQKQNNNSNVIDSINSLRNIRKNMRGETQKENVQGRLANKAKDRLGQAGKKTLGKVGKRLAKEVGKKAIVAAGQALASSAPAWGIPALIIGVVLFLIITTTIVVFGGGKEGAEMGSNLCTGTCQTGACTGTDMPDTTATCTDPTRPTCCVPQPLPGTQPSIRFYCQYDDAWETSTCKINKYGCTPTSVAMILASYGNTKINPLNTALLNNSEGCSGPSSIYDFIPWIKSLGYTVGPSLAKGTSFDTSSAKTYLANGYFIIAGANIRYNKSLSSSGGHAFVISALSDNNTALVYDPTFCSSDTSFVSRTFNVFGFGNPLLCNTYGCYWFWALPIKKL